MARVDNRRAQENNRTVYRGEPGPVNHKRCCGELRNQSPERIATLRVMLALFATMVIALNANASSVAENIGSGDRSQTQQRSRYEKNHFYNLGNREGYGDHKKRQPREHNREFSMTPIAEPTKMVMKGLGRKAYLSHRPTIIELSARSHCTINNTMTAQSDK